LFEGLTKLLVVGGFLASAYLLGWDHAQLKSSTWNALPLLVFVVFGAGLWMYGQQINMPTQLARWVMLLPLAFFMGTLRHIAPWWLTLIGFILSIGVSALFHLLREKQAPPKQRLILTAIDSGVLLVLLTQLFLPRDIFAGLLAFLPAVVLVIFYNFILERDRLLRAKALAVGEPPTWLIKANVLLPSSTYLFLLLPGLLFAEALVFHAFYVHPQAPKIKQQAYQKVSAQHPTKTKPPASKTETTLIPPTLGDWLRFTVTIKIKARHRGQQVPTVRGEVQFLDVGQGYTLFASMIRAFLIFFYAKRLLLIYLILMDSITGVRVHRIGLENEQEEAPPRLAEHKQILLRTLDSFPRFWAGFLLRSIQGRHGHFDPISGVIYGIGIVKNRWLPRILPKMSLQSPPKEPGWSRLLRDEEIQILGQMQDRKWAMEACIDMVSPAHSSTFRGRVFYYTHYPILGRLTEWYFRPPETEVQARIIEEMASLLTRTITTKQHTNTFSDVQTEQLTPKEIWAMRDRALEVLLALAHSDTPTLRMAALRAIEKIAHLPRPVGEVHQQIWLEVAEQVGTHLTSLRDNQQSWSWDPIQPHTKEDPLPDPFAPYLTTSFEDERKRTLLVLGRIGTKQAVLQLKQAMEDDSKDTAYILKVLGYGDRANGHIHAGLAQTEEVLLQHCKDQDTTHQEIALSSLVRIAYPTPITQMFVTFQRSEQIIETQHAVLSSLQTDIEHLTSKQQTEHLDTEERDQLWELFETRRSHTTLLEEALRENISHLHDTYWSLVHYSALILIASYVEGEGMERSPEFTQYLQKLSFEDQQGWDEFYAQLPPLQDQTSWIAPFYSFHQKLSENKETQSSMFKRFLELQERLREPVSNHADQDPWEHLHTLRLRYKTFLFDTLREYRDCMRVRPFVIIPKESQEGHWRITFSGLSPWIRPLSQEQHITPRALHLSYEQFAPMSLEPLAQIEWTNTLSDVAIQQGELPPSRMWAYNFNRSIQLHMRRLGPNDERGYWRSHERLGPGAEWEQQLSRLATQLEHRTLSKLDFSYLIERSKASFRQVFARSRLREQDPLMIKRDMEYKLDNFLEQDRHKLAESPSIFLLAGSDGVGHTTLMLRHARRQQSGEHEGQITLFMDAGLLHPDATLADWLTHELQLELDEALSASSPQKRLEEVMQAIQPLFADVELASPLTFYLDGFHEHPKGVELLADALTLASRARATHLHCKFILSVRKSYLENNIEHPVLSPFVVQGRFSPSEEMFYRERGVHGVAMELTEFLDEKTPGVPEDKTEVERAYQRYYQYTDTSGSPRYRPNRASTRDIERYGMTRTLLAAPTLLPVIMETFHQKELPEDLQLMELMSSYLEQFTQPERECMQSLAQKMLYGQEHTTETPDKWESDPLLEESQLLEDPELIEYVEPFKYGTRIYDDLRARGLLIRRWRLPKHKEHQDARPVRHVTFTSPQLQEYLLFQDLWSLTSQPQQSEETPLFQTDQVQWLLALSSKSEHFKALSGALSLYLLRSIETHQAQLVADFNDRSEGLGRRNRHILLHAFLHLDPRQVTRSNHLLSIVFKEISGNDLELLQELGQTYRRRGLYQEVEALFGMVLDQEQFAKQLPHFPSLYTELLLERADNKRQLLAQQSGGQLGKKEYQQGRALYQKTYEMLRDQQDSKLQQARVLRFQALYELDTNHLEEAEETLSQAWSLGVRETRDDLNDAWIRHLQSSLQRRKVETQKDMPPSQKRQLLQAARTAGEEGLSIAIKCKTGEQTELLAQINDNLARILFGLANINDQTSQKQQEFAQAIEYFKGSIRAKRMLSDYLGMAMSYSGLGSVYMESAKLKGTDEQPETNDWTESKQQFMRALKLNRDKLHSEFGIALSYQALADLYELHPDYRAERLSALLEALLAFARIGNTNACQGVIKQLVQEVATMPLQEMRRFLMQVVEQLQNITELSDWLISTLWKEFSSVLGDRIPRVLRDLFAKIIQS
tara:strand:- start:690 stop:6623 length:5934 start_codon:yes stop_codon:yes gene_type:complete